MTDNFLYSLNVVLPIVILVFLGWYLKRRGIINDAFCSSADKLVFKIMLPCLLFLETARLDPDAGVGRWSFAAFATVGIVLAFILLCIIVPIIIKDNAKRGAVIQGSFRSNFSILGLPLARAMFGDAGVEAVAILTPFVITTFNILAVSVLTLFAPKESKKSAGKTILKALANIVINPLIVAVILGVAFMRTGIELPVFADRTLSYLADATTALSLISLGAGITVSSIKENIKYSLPAALTKTLLLPTIAAAAAYAAGFRQEELAALFILFGTPTAVASYVMAKNMKSDGSLAGQILLLSTMLCVFTIFAGIFTMKSLKWL